MTPSRINALGARLAKSTLPSPDDLETLTQLQDEYMKPLERTGAILRERLDLAEHGTFFGVELTASNRLKTTGPIIDKLRRKTRLSSMQDIVGYRIVGDLTLHQQDQLVDELRECFDKVRVVDRRARPMYGYRAVHVIAEVDGFPVEIQVRTYAQDGWAQMMEGYADNAGREIRYGEMPPNLKSGELRDVTSFVKRLLAVSDALAEFEVDWDRLARTMQKIRLLREQRKQHGGTRRIKRSLEAAETEFARLESEYNKSNGALDAALKRLAG